MQSKHIGCARGPRIYCLTNCACASYNKLLGQVDLCHPMCIGPLSLDMDIACDPEAHFGATLLTARGGLECKTVVTLCCYYYYYYFMFTIIK